ncbi:MAG: class I SAM-dependent methyltransferase [Prevotellaceae bacterium]|jgi:ubiquinone/menaquinone biosynthesis C-methylase UbiE|nr:class I SAM-dependent methyltransferase [Prevotellaceae bacterium]
MRKDIQLQRNYYEKTAQDYNKMHVSGTGEHELACALIHALSVHYGFQSILDVGSGTGRALLELGKKLPECRIVGIEPVAALHQVGHNNGISSEQLIDGDATDMQYADNSFDLVCELGVLHHIPKPRLAVAEMLRVARKAIFISDSNRFGQGPLPAKLIKLFCSKMKVWPVVDFVKTKGKGYMCSEGDGISYSYSVFDDYDFIRAQCKQVMVFNLDGSGKHAITGAPHIGLLGIKTLNYSGGEREGGGVVVNAYKSIVYLLVINQYFPITVSKKVKNNQ